MLRIIRETFGLRLRDGGWYISRDGKYLLRVYLKGNIFEAGPGFRFRPDGTFIDSQEDTSIMDLIEPAEPPEGKTGERFIKTSQAWFFRDGQPIKTIPLTDIDEAEYYKEVFHFDTVKFPYKDLLNREYWEWVPF